KVTGEKARVEKMRATLEKHRCCCFDGSTGTLGSYLLEDLTASPNVSRIYCLNRSANSEERQVQVSASRGLPTQWHSQRIKFLTYDLSKEYLGLDVEVYSDLISHATLILHNAWQVIFNLSLASFEPVHIQRVRRLIDFSARSLNRARIFFVSSVGAVMNWSANHNGTVPEEIIDDFTVPQTMEYAEAKYVAERLLEMASRTFEIPVSICRVGQISGPVGTEKGMWNKREWFPSIVTSSKYLGVIPDFLGVMNNVKRIAVDLLSKSWLSLYCSETALQLHHTSFIPSILTPPLGLRFSLCASLSPFAARTQQYVKEQLGQADEKTQLPPEYIDLEKRVDALKQVHQKLLQVTSQYSNEAYDYPPNIRESFNDLGRTISEKVHLLSSATSPSEAQAAFTAPPSAKPQPKTFNHAIARASLAGSQLLTQTNAGTGEDPLATALEKYALASEKVGEARLAQDAQVQSRFLSGWNTTLNTNLMFAARARRGVENARLSLDATKAKAKGTLARGMNPDDESVDEEARAQVEQKEDEFVGQTEEAVGVMKNVSLFPYRRLLLTWTASADQQSVQVLDTPEPLRNLADLIAAQLEFHKKAYEILSELAPVVDGLQVEQEVRRHESYTS
ncbi:hypothetical protein MMC08_000284, partial [Hypocenomyce scalaris]|nr:hypothetical protein [Hypocenomyce scalaris]